MVWLYKTVVRFILILLSLYFKSISMLKKCFKFGTQIKELSNQIKEQEIDLNTHYFCRFLKTQDNVYVKKF